MVDCTLPSHQHTISLLRQRQYESLETGEPYITPIVSWAAFPSVLQELADGGLQKVFLPL